MPKVLVANRGEIARRVFRTARRLGFGCVAVYSDADAREPFVAEADAAIRIGPAPAAESYLLADRIVDAALRTGADVVHPGYGFLAEDPRLAEACMEAGVAFAGPAPDVLRVMGDKAAAKALARRAGVRLLSAGDGGSLADAARACGYPVILKPVAGGGGKGMVVVQRPEDLERSAEGASRVATASFGDGRLMAERYVPDARHVEVQVLGDAHGTVVHLLERDCSLQRRHQKVLEETPAPALDDPTRAALHDAAVALAHEASYTGAGTMEFLVAPDGGFGFIECNARLQVEHPVTEAVTGVDLVEWQLRIALGERLGFSQGDVRADGHAVEVRLYAEDPREGFLPQTGTVAHVRWPAGVRVDAGVEEGSVVTPHYDPMLAKLVAHGASREEALVRLRAALDATEVLGVRTNASWLRSVLDAQDVAKGRVTTATLDGLTAPEARTHPRALEVAAAAEAARRLATASGADPWGALGPWRAGGRARSTVVIRVDGDEHAVAVHGIGPFRAGDTEVEAASQCHAWTADGAEVAAAFADGVWWVGTPDPAEIALGAAPRSADAGGTAHLGAPMPGTVAAVRVQSGDAVSRGQELVVVEAMKMEHPVLAPADGVVKAVLVSPGDRVERGQALVDVESS